MSYNHGLVVSPPLTLPIYRLEMHNLIDPQVWLKIFIFGQN